MFKIITDTNCDLPSDYYQLHNIKAVKMPYILDGVVYGRDKDMSASEFYSLMRSGKMPTTSPASKEDIKQVIAEALDESKEILFIAFSSGLSATYNAAVAASEELMRERGGCNIIVVDSLMASLGEGLMVHKAVQLRDAGNSLKDTAEWLMNHRSNFVGIFTVDDLLHLQRGGRVSKASAILGTIVGIKPTLHVDDAGKLVSIDKVRGRKKALQSLVEYMENKTKRYVEGNDIVCVSHADDPDAAEDVCNMIRSKLGINDFMINNIGASIGSHAGPGTVALFFMGSSR